MTDTAVETFGLTKRFGRQLAVGGIDLKVPTGSVYGFLGPNGSGKTTTIRMLLGLVVPDRGSQRNTGKVSAATYSNGATARRCTRRGSGLPPVSDRAGEPGPPRCRGPGRDPGTARARIDAALDRVGLLAAAGKRYRAYSLGMRQRLAIAAALLSPRQLLILDEPTNGLDPQGTREVRHLVTALAADGVTILVSSHLLAEVEQMCTHLGVMQSGRLVAQGSIDEIRSSNRQVARVDTDRPQDAAKVLLDLGLTDVSVEGQRALATVGAVAIEKIVPALVNDGVPVLGFTVEAPSLEDMFVSLTGEGFDVSG